MGDCTFVTVLMIITLLRAQILVLHALPLKFYWHILDYINIHFWQSCKTYQNVVCILLGISPASEV